VVKQETAELDAARGSKAAKKAVFLASVPTVSMPRAKQLHEVGSVGTSLAPASAATSLRSVGPRDLTTRISYIGQRAAGDICCSWGHLFLVTRSGALTSPAPLPHAPSLPLACAQIESSPDFTNVTTGLTPVVLACAACSLYFLSSKTDGMLEVRSLRAARPGGSNAVTRLRGAPRSMGRAALPSAASATWATACGVLGCVGTSGLRAVTASC
jgi:hypothetical protein